MRRVKSVFARCAGKPRGNMVKGRRKRVQTKNTVHMRTALSSQCEANSPMKKEAKLNVSKSVKNVNLGQVHSVSEEHKPHACINSFLYAQIADVSTNEASTMPIEENFFRSEETSDIQDDILIDVGQFKTDETPVAVPIHGPSTPHRIKMPSSELEDLDDRNANENMHKKSVITSALNLEQQSFKKPASHNRRKLNSNQSAISRSIDPLNAKSTNHKLTDYFPVRRSVRKSKKAVLEEKQRDMENKVLCQVEEGLEIKHFAGKGRGIVTTREFMKGEFVVEYIGELIDQVTAKKREKIYAQDQNTGCYMYYFQHRNHQYCVDATAETDKLGRLVNHSRNGNLIARVVEVGSTPHLVLTAKENIPIGVEITYDYGDRSREAIRHHPWLAL
ncbi:N-lysine methyltransferase KMT5A-B isoform X1 [Frieseomelitta varia]|uniref:N-lysine methyltransferase KMT5A-B isoform X1 n=1 Tax=Frieseomelitta varia TaxID=561572 RepID=UPI001CB6A2AA|nr:N-lysine methyltransferase KMT5A-B isoform X1 [Frieseomelitta varia]